MPDRKRPTQTKGGMVRIVGYLRPEDYDRFIRYCEEDERKQSDVIRRSVKEHLKARGVDFGK